MSTAEALTCKEVVELVTDYVEGTLPREERRRFEQHLSACPHCDTYLAQMRATIAAVGKLSEDDIPPAARDDLLRTFRTWRDG
jgi:anti-sigma factor RsiW